MILTELLQWAALIGAGIAIVGFIDSRKRHIMDKGSREKEMDLMKLDVAAAHDKIRNLESLSQNTRVDTAEIKKDIEFIKLTLEETRDSIKDIMAELRSNPRKEC